MASIIKKTFDYVPGNEFIAGFKDFNVRRLMYVTKEIILMDAEHVEVEIEKEKGEEFEFNNIVQ